MVEAEGAARSCSSAAPVEVAPLAFMRGRTLNNSFIILDEAQNTTPEQMKMFLTRIGFGSKAVITGDTTQVDVPGRPGRSGLRSGLERGRDRDASGRIDGLGFVRLSVDRAADVVRHRIVADIVDAYERGGQPGRRAGAARRARRTPPGRPRPRRARRSGCDGDP
jgi:phosphate starvation-inducible PhoH-like protein